MSSQAAVISTPNVFVKFTVYGLPVPQGSTRAFIPKNWNRPVITTDNKKLKPWRQEVSQTAKAVMDDAFLVPLTRDVPIQVNVAFYFPRPKSLKKSVTEKTTKPDLDKLERSLFDSLTGIVFEDDSQVCRACTWKGFGSTPRAEIEVLKIY